MGSATNLLSKLAGVRSRLDEPDGGGPAPTTPATDVGAVREPPPPESATDEAGVAHTSRCSVSGCMRLSPESQEPRGADTPEGGTAAPPPDVGAVREPPLPAGQPQGLPLRPDENTQNRGNEAKKSLKTNDWAKIECVKRTHFCARKARNEANKVAFQCAGRLRQRAQRGRATTQRGMAILAMRWSFYISGEAFST